MIHQTCDLKLIQETAARYKARTEERRARLKRLAKEGVAAVEEPERLEVRRELMAQDGLVEGNAPEVLAQIIDVEQILGRERLIGNNDLLPLHYLEIGLHKARSICRIEIRDATGTFAGYGTGFLVSPTLLLTNNHVLPSAAVANRSLAEFNYEDDANQLPKPIKVFKLDGTQFFFTDKALDFALVAVHPQATDGSALDALGHLPFIAESGKAVLGESVAVIQHPEGRKKHLALRSNRIIDVFDDFVHYETDTMPGSSGSPVFSDRWDVVALHHSGVPRRNAQGRILNKQGRIWKEEMGDEEIDWVANEGIRISSIARLLEAKPDWTADQKSLLQAMITHVT